MYNYVKQASWQPVPIFLEYKEVVRTFVSWAYRQQIREPIYAIIWVACFLGGELEDQGSFATHYFLFLTAQKTGYPHFHIDVTSPLVIINSY